MSRNFDGNLANYISFADASSAWFLTAQPWTFLAFFRVEDTAGDDRCIIAKESAAGGQFLVRTDQGAASQDIEVRNSPGSIMIKGGNNVALNTWYLLAITNDGTGGVGGLALYLLNMAGTYLDDGVTGTMQNDDDLDQPIYIGARPPASSDPMDGDIALVCYVAGELSKAEISAYLRDPYRMALSFKSTYGVEWFFKLGEGSPEPDWSGNNNSGTITGTLAVGQNPPIPLPIFSQETFSFVAVEGAPVFATARGFSGSQNDAAPLATSLSTARGFSRGLGIANYYGGTRAHRILTHGQYWTALDVFTEGHYTFSTAIISSIARAYGGGLNAATPDALQLTAIANGVANTENKAASAPSLVGIAYGASVARNLASFLVNAVSPALGQSAAQNDIVGSLSLASDALAQAMSRNLTGLAVATTLSAYGFSGARNKTAPFVPGFSAAHGQSKGRGSFVAIPAIATGASGATQARNLVSAASSLSSSAYGVSQARSLLVPLAALSSAAYGQSQGDNIAALLLAILTAARGDSKGLGIALPLDIPQETGAASGQSRGRGSFVSLTSIASGAIGQSSGLAGTLLSGIVYVVVADYIILFPDTDIDVLFPDNDSDILFPDDEIDILFG